MAIRKDRYRRQGRAEITTFLVERGMDGFSAGQKITDKLGMRASTTAELVFEDCVVPAENVVGKPGESMIHLMRNLSTRGSDLLQ